ncbi:MAG TPA: hypothetical protein VFE96_04665 [Candidatus Bathyarchaeia archaeon]|jgi:hypothetical protein|nr:hypothetical protein [Candidatus Bathyarchaeia archaeon]
MTQQPKRVQNEEALDDEEEFKRIVEKNLRKDRELLDELAKI